jgi:hypothetical protein
MIVFFEPRGDGAKRISQWSWIYHRGSRSKLGNAWLGAKRHDGVKLQWKWNVHLRRSGRQR